MTEVAELMVKLDKNAVDRPFFGESGLTTVLLCKEKLSMHIKIMDFLACQAKM